MSETPMTPEQQTAITALIGDVKPATSRLLVQLAESVRDRREHDHPKWEDLYCLNLVSWMGERMAPVLRRLLYAEVRIAELEAQAELLAGALVERPEDPVPAGADGITRRIAPTQALREDESAGYPAALPWAALMDHEDLTEFLDELAASAITHASSERALAEVEDTCGRWRVIAEAQHAHNTAPGPNAEAGDAS